MKRSSQFYASVGSDWGSSSSHNTGNAHNNNTNNANIAGARMDPGNLHVRMVSDMGASLSTLKARAPAPYETSLRNDNTLTNSSPETMTVADIVTAESPLSRSQKTPNKILEAATPFSLSSAVSPSTSTLSEKGQPILTHMHPVFVCVCVCLKSMQMYVYTQIRMHT